LRSPGSPCPGLPTVGSEPDVSFRVDFHLPKRTFGEPYSLKIAT
jgi:hypothetical protein